MMMNIVKPWYNKPLEQQLGITNDILCIGYRKKYLTGPRHWKLYFNYFITFPFESSRFGSTIRSTSDNLEKWPISSWDRLRANSFTDQSVGSQGNQ